jgi:aromatic-L-amino-acid decarboxylase
VALGRRFRALKLWFVMRYFGARGLRERIRYHCRLASGFADRIDRDPAWERAAPVPFSTVVFRWVGGESVPGEGRDQEDLDRTNVAIMEAANATGRVFLSHTVLNGRTFLRLAVGNLRTEAKHIERAWRILSEAVGSATESTAGAPGG